MRYGALKGFQLIAYMEVGNTTRAYTLKVVKQAVNAKEKQLTAFNERQTQITSTAASRKQIEIAKCARIRLLLHCPGHSG